MTSFQKTTPSSAKQLRLWPGVALAVLILLLKFTVPIFAPDSMALVFLGALVGVLLILLWWLFFSRAPWLDRLGAVVLVVAAMYITFPFLHMSIQGGAMGFLFPAMSLPILSVVLVAWAAATRRLAAGPRRVALLASILLTCGAFTLVRTGGMSGDGEADTHLRWTQTPEERLLAQGGDTPGAVPSAGAAAAASAGADWPGFRGASRDSVVRGVRLKTDWTASPPVQLWRKPIGPAWSSFAVRGPLMYTQEQRGEEEVVSCYDMTTGEPVWRHSDAARFWESNAGAGPRATPTLSNGRVYTLGGTGIVNALDAGDGTVVWSRHAEKDTGAKLPGWGFAGSPLVLGDLVIVATSGKLVAYDLATGAPRWLGTKGGSGYSSPQVLTIGGVEQIVQLSTFGAVGVAPADGTLLWEHEWKGDGIVQPAMTADGDILIGSGSGLSESGMRRLAVAHGPSGWTVEERWTSTGLKPYFNDFVVHAGHAFGFDGAILSCIDLKDGQRTWKGGRYGHGQLFLLPEQDLLLVLSEQGELALVAAKTDTFNELAR
ncbi:MAG TPA: PQQ-binding-like beta-propeller repeat protein, partial [Candidatus Polarisedimenticolia bacterium]|nr:PQQ-binding-like beta-propeller repeat protein [Candidatus Polarisedimenticolia bacterium]